MMSTKMKFKNRFLSIFFCLMVSTTFYLNGVERIQKGKIPVYNNTYFYERTSSTLTIRDTGHHVVFQNVTRQKGQWIAGFGHNGKQGTFYVFHESFCPEDTTYRLEMNAENDVPPPVLKSREPVYCPILVEKNGSHVVYITEKFQIIIQNLHTGTICHRIRFNSPVRSLKEELFGNQRIISYQKLNRGKFENHFFYVKNIGSKAIQVSGTHDPGVSLKPQTRIYPDAKQKYPLEVLPLDYRKIVCFGDSITYGQIDSEYHPELGYIPRLQEILDNDGFQTTVINEGLGNRKATTSFDDFTTAISHHRGKYLLLHLGTNDVRFWTIPISDVIYSIQLMTDTALAEGVLPVLSTLIPRNHPIYFDILRHRGKLISSDIRQIAKTADLPMVDFWNLFLNYPESDGGNLSLMSDDTHPSGKGYQLMAENWHPAVLRFPPDAPKNITVRSVSSRSVSIQWDPNKEFDIEYYLVEFGYVQDSLNHRVAADSPDFTFIRYYFTNPLLSTLYYKISAVDQFGHIGPATGIHTLRFESD